MSKIKKIILIGPKHVGKSTVAKKLSKLFLLPFIDSDEKILHALQEKNQNFTSIAKAYQHLGAEVFKKLELQSIEHVLNLSKFVFATGGGLASNEEAFKFLQTRISALTLKQKQSSEYAVILLKDRANKIWERVRNKSIPAYVKTAVHKQLNLALHHKGFPSQIAKLERAYKKYFIETFKERSLLYATVANIIIEIQDKSAFQVSKEIYTTFNHQ